MAVHVVMWSGGQVVRWSGAQVRRWSGGQVVRWSGGQGRAGQGRAGQGRAGQGRAGKEQGQGMVKMKVGDRNRGQCYLGEENNAMVTGLGRVDLTRCSGVRRHLDDGKNSGYGGTRDCSGSASDT